MESTSADRAEEQIRFLNDRCGHGGCVNHVTGMECKPCVRVGHLILWRTQEDSNL